MYFASHEFQNGASFDNGLFADVNEPGHSDATVVQEQVLKLGVQNNGSVFEKLENADCIAAYARTPLLDRRTLILVSSTMPHDNLWINEQSTKENCTTSGGLPIDVHSSAGHVSLISCLDNSSLYTVTSYRSSISSLDNWYYWICSQGPSDQVASTDHTPSLCGEGLWKNVTASNWTLDGFKIDYCLSERPNDGCKLNIARGLLIIVICFNAIVCQP